MQALLIIFCICILTSGAQAQDTTEDIILGKSITLTSHILKEKREIWIYLPEKYEETREKYPVFYVLDGMEHFHHLSGLIHYLSLRGHWPHMIVVGILNVDRSTRSRDFSPPRPAENSVDIGADLFLRFLQEELFPLVDGDYQTQPFRILGGHSRAGLFTVYTLLKAPELFNAYIATSPWLAYADHLLIKQAETILGEKNSLPKFLYMTAGKEPGIVKSMSSFTELLKKKAPPDLDWVYVYLDQEDHGSLPHQGFFNGMRALYPKWRMPAKAYEEGSTTIIRHYQMLSNIYGYEIKPYFVDLYNIGNELIRWERIKLAIDVFELNAKYHPENWVTYKLLGEVYVLDNNTERAILNYEKALELNPQFIQAKEILAKLREKIR